MSLDQHLGSIDYPILVIFLKMKETVEPGLCDSINRFLSLQLCLGSDRIQSIAIVRLQRVCTSFAAKFDFGPAKPSQLSSTAA